MERYRRGKAYRAKAGSVNVLGGAPFGYRYLSKSPGSGAGYEIAEHEAVLVAEMFRRYAETAPPSPTWPGGSPARTSPPAPASPAGTGR